MLYRFCRFILLVLFKVFCRLEVVGRDRFPRRGGLLLAVNHASYIDPLLAGCSAPRDVWYMARESLMKTRLSRWFLTSINSIPLDRAGGDVGAFKACVAKIKEGKPVLIFPEGTRSFDGNLKPPKLGIGLLAMLGKIDILPCYVHGSFETFPRHSKFPRPTKIRVAFGPLLEYTKEFGDLVMRKDSYKQIAHRVMEEIGSLRKDMVAMAGR